MCLVAIALGQSPAWPLVLASNRDEFFARPTLPLSRWTTPCGTAVVSGRDQQAGGIWLGATPSGRVAVLTNVREPGAESGVRSRGHLPLDWLTSAQSADLFARTLQAGYPQAHSGFNLLIGDLVHGRWHWLSNRRPGPGGLAPGWQHRALAPGIYGLSNAFLDTDWPKTTRLRQALARALGTPQSLQETLWHALADDRPAPDGALPDTGIGRDAERWLSSAWVRSPDGRYGTRASSLLVAETAATGATLQVLEKTWFPEGGSVLRAERLALDLPPPMARPG